MLKAQISLDVFNASPALGLAYMAFAACYGLSIAVHYTTVPTSNNRDSGPRTVNPNHRATERDGRFDDSYIQESVAGGFAVGCRVAAVVWTIMFSLFFWTSIFDVFDWLDILALKGLLFSILPAIGALLSAAWHSDRQTIRRVSSDEEKGGVERNWSYGR